MSTTRIVIAGGGIAGVPLANEIKAHLHGQVEVIVVSERPDFHFTPSNPWIALGLRENKEITFELEPLLGARKIELRVQAVESFQPKNNQVVLSDGTHLEYDYLGIATGIRPDWSRVACADDMHHHSVIQSQQATAARGAYFEFLKQAGPVVVAALPGASLLGPMYEYAFLMDSDLRRRALRSKVRITLITPEPYAGHVGLDKPMARDALHQALTSQGIGWIGNSAVQSCESGRLQFITYDDPEHPAEHELDVAYTMLWPAFRGVDAVTRCDALSDEHGLIAVDEYQRACGHENIFALGAATANPVMTKTVVPVGAPDAVYSIQQQVTVVTRNIANSLRGEPLIQADIERAHWFADTSKRGAAHLASPQLPLRNIQLLNNGQWIHRAKRDFESYFINQVLFGAGQHGQVAALVRRLSSQAKTGHVDTDGSSIGNSLKLSSEARRKIRTLSGHLNISPDSFARELLDKAIAEAFAGIDPEMRQKAIAELDSAEKAEREANQERLRFLGGNP